MHLDGELIPPGDDSIRVVAKIHPFRNEIVERRFAAGATLAEIVSAVSAPPRLRVGHHVFIGDHLIPPDLWRRVRPKPGSTVTMRALPLGGGGSTDILRIVILVAAIALSVAFPYLAPGFAALYPTLTALIQAAIPLIASVLVNVLVPPSRPKLPSLSGDPRDSPTLFISGARNDLRPFGAVPRVLGKHRLVPPYGALPFTEIEGKDQYLRLLFDLGYGPLEISDLRIGENALRKFEAVEYEIRQGFPDDLPLTLYTKDVFEEALSVLADAATGFIVRTTQPAIDEISIDITFPNGLVKFNADGSKVAVTVQLSVEYSPIGAGTWKPLTAAVAIAAQTTAILQRPAQGTRTWRIRLHPITGVMKIGGGTASAGPFTATTPPKADYITICKIAVPALGALVLTDERDAALVAAGYFAPVLNGDNSVTVGAGTLTPPAFIVTEKSTSAVRASLQAPVGRGQYDVRLKRLTADSADEKIVDKVFWTALRSIADTAPILATGHALVAMRIKATDQLNGVVDRFNCIVQSILMDYSGGVWVEQATSNPASLFREVLQGRANKRPLPDARVDLVGLQSWADKCRTANREFNMVIDFKSTVREVLQDIAAAGRATPSINDGLWGVLIDEPQASVLQQFTPRNSWGFKGTKIFVDLPDGFRVRFVNRNADWRQEERIVYRDGFSAANATKFEGLDFAGITDPDQIFKETSFHHAQAKLRPEIFKLNVDVENLVAKRGSRVGVTHSVIAVGLASGRIKALAVDGGGNVASITSDEALTMEAGKSYGLGIRTVANATVKATIVTAPGDQTVVAISPAIPAAQAPEVGDLFAFGELGSEYLDCLITAIRPARDLAAELTLVPYSPAVYTADQGTIPAFDSKITPPQGSVAPAIGLIRSDSTVLFREVDGSLSARIVVQFLRTAAVPALATAIEAAYRVSGSAGTWSYLSTKSADAQEVAIAGVDDGDTYEMRFRYVLGSDRGAWTAIYTHTVIGKSDPPPDVIDLLLENGAAVWTYPLAPPDLAGFRVKHNPGVNRDWQNGTIITPGSSAGVGLVTATRIELGALVSSQRTVMVKAVDTSGNESVNPAVLLLGLGEIVVDNLVFAYDDKAAGFVGTKTNCSVFGGNLVANDTGGLFWTGQASAQFWGADPAALFWNTGYLQLSYVLPFLPETQYLPSQTIVEATVSAQNWMLEYRPSWTQGAFWGSDPTALFWGADPNPFWPQAAAPGFQPWPGTLEMTRQPYELKLSATSNLGQSIVSALAVKLDVDEIDQFFNNVIVPITGVRLPLTKGQRQIVGVQITLENDGGNAVYAKRMDGELVPGPLIMVFDALGNPTTGLIDALAQAL